MFIKSSYSHNPRESWVWPIKEKSFPGLESIKFFDQSGYALCTLELMYAIANHSYLNANREKQGMYMPWIELDNKIEGPHINHSWIMERKGYGGEALEQLEEWCKDCPLLYKVVKLKSKWGIDISFDYVDRQGNVMELFHYEWDSHILDEVLETKEKIEKIIFDTDWDDFARMKLRRKSEWCELDFIAQSKWTTEVLDLPPENFKLVPWKI
tara:strand:- start:1575 stop:2207 length:633 start_codon:yes stop_codon:yes gene_type:complete